MKRLDDNTVEFETDAERIIKEIHSALMDQGYSPSAALIVMRGSMTDSGTPTLDRALTPDLVDWLVR